MIAPMLPMMAGGVLLPKWLKIRFRQDFTVERKLLSAMAAHSAVSLIAAGVIENIDVFFVQRYLSTSEVGLLSAVSKISMMIMLVAYSLGNVLNPRVARYHHRADLAAYLQKAAILCVISLLGFLAFIPLARLSILLTIGSQYQDGLPILLILVGSAFLTIALIPFVALFYSFKAEWYFSLSGIGQLLIVLIGNGVFVPQFGLAASAWTRLVARLFLFIFTVVGGVFLYWRHTKKSPAL
jgi:O-antigen/teichoic acid export membrane protein